MAFRLTSEVHDRASGSSISRLRGTGHDSGGLRARCALVTTAKYRRLQFLRSSSLAISSDMVSHRWVAIDTTAPYLLRAAIDGVGIAYLFEQDAASSLASGRVGALLTDWTPRFPGFHLRYSGARLFAPARGLL